MSWRSIPALSDFEEMVTIYSIRIALAIIVLVLGWVIGHLLSSLLNRVIGKMGWESAFRRTLVGRAILRSGYTPSSFFAVFGKGVVYFFAVISALNLLSIPSVTATVQAFLEHLSSFVEGVLILVAGLIFVDWIGESIEKGSSSIVQLHIISGFIRIMLYFVIITLALAQMEIDVTILYIFAQAFAWGLAIAMGIALGLYLKDKIGPELDRMLIRESEKAENTTEEL